HRLRDLLLAEQEGPHADRRDRRRAHARHLADAPGSHQLDHGRHHRDGVRHDLLRADGSVLAVGHQARVRIMNAVATSSPGVAMSKKWYVVHTYSGFENKVRDALQQRIKEHHMEDHFGEILIPTETVSEPRAGGKTRV